ncbi:hypothetical protein CIB48_g9630 [Xylaria polymorpha]|nr:hypothetical protein CIB48_g9630 [Xylaria polymorpha]
MKLHYIGIVRNDSKPGVELVSEKELSAYSRFTRQNYGEFMTLFSKTVAERTRPGQRQDVEEQGATPRLSAPAARTKRTERQRGIDADCILGNRLHISRLRPDRSVCGIIMSDHEYPALVAHQLLSKVMDEFLASHPRSAWASASANSIAMPQLKEYLIKYQDPHQADSIMKIQKELDETKIVLHKTIESVLQRGEKIDDLVAKSDGLSNQSKMFYQQAKKQNSCCVVM